MNFFTAVNATPYISNAAPVDIIQTDLLNWLDFSNTSCYPGSGSTATDLKNASTFQINGPSFSSTAGGCFDFDGVNDSIYQSAYSLSGDYSWCAWVNVSTLPGTTNVGVISLEQTTSSFARLIARPDTSPFIFRSRHYAVNADETTGRNFGTWWFVVMSHDGDTIRTYVNGSLTASAARTTDMSISNEYLAIGCFSRAGTPASFSNFFLGLIGEVHIYNQALSLTDIEYNFNATKSRYGY